MMTFTEQQTELLDEIKELIEKHELPENIAVLVSRLCRAFFQPGLELDVFIGIGGTRIVISNPNKEGTVLKIAYNCFGVASNRDEYDTYHQIPDDIKEFLAEPIAITDDGLVLVMERCEPIPEEEFPDYEHQLNIMLERIRFTHYLDPLYHHSFGLTEGGTLKLLDYGETEHIEVISPNQSQSTRSE